VGEGEGEVGQVWWEMFSFFGPPEKRHFKQHGLPLYFAPMGKSFMCCEPRVEVFFQYIIVAGTSATAPHMWPLNAPVALDVTSISSTMSSSIATRMDAVPAFAESVLGSELEAVPGKGYCWYICLERFLAQHGKPMPLCNVAIASTIFEWLNLFEECCVTCKTVTGFKHSGSICLPMF
jgi:hypothetical protein